MMTPTTTLRPHPSLTIALGLLFGFTTLAGCAGGGGGRRGGDTGGGGGDEETGGSSGGGGSRGGSGGSGGQGGRAGAGGQAGQGGGGSSGQGGKAGAGGEGGAGGAAGADAGAPGGEPDGAVSTPGNPQYSKTVTLDTTATGAPVMGDVPKYPVAILLNANNFDFSQAKAHGEDVRFLGADGAPLPYAIESWDATAKLAAIWVKVDVKGNAKTTLKMTWGDAGASDGSDSKKVFDTAEGWTGVWHLSEPGNTTMGGYKDATGNAADATQKAMTAAGSAPGRIGNALSLASASKQYLQVDLEKSKLFDLPNKMTYSLWVNPKSHTVEYQCMFSKGEGGFRIHFYGSSSWDENRGRNIVEMCAEGTASNDMCPVKPGTGTDVAPGKWTLITAVHDHPRLFLYVNGAQEATITANETWKSDATKPVSIGNNSSALGRAFDGLLDEPRVLLVAKDASWIKLDFESQKEGSKLVTFGETVKK
jgi:hypothetical protein